MDRDFTLRKYKELCDTIIKSGYTVMPVKKYLSIPQHIQKSRNPYTAEFPPSTMGRIENIVVLRHDIDKNPENALKMAQLENKLGIRSTYYFRMNDEVFKPSIIKQIADLGHEIGYHYEALDKAHGDHERAIEIFEKELDELREIVDVKTICMHGSPLKPWRNRALWEKYDFKQYDILGEPYISIDYNEMAYLTDTSRTWDGEKYTIDDFVDNTQNISVKCTDDLIDLVKRKQIKQMCISAHPQRWSDNARLWFKELIWQNLKNVGKRILKKKDRKNK